MMQGDAFRSKKSYNSAGGEYQPYPGKNRSYRHPAAHNQDYPLYKFRKKAAAAVAASAAVCRREFPAFLSNRPPVPGSKVSLPAKAPAGPRWMRGIGIPPSFFPLNPAAPRLVSMSSAPAGYNHVISQKMTIGPCPTCTADNPRQSGQTILSTLIAATEVLADIDTRLG